MSEPVPQQPSPKPPLRYLAALLFLLSFAYRLIGIGWGLPNDLHHHSYHPDEPIVLMYSQEIEPGRLDFDPGFYHYGTLYLTLVRLASAQVQAFTGGPDPKEPESVRRFVGDSHLASRVISALAGAGTVLIAFLVFRRWASPLAASLGALLIAVAPGHVVHSRFATVDITASFLLAVSALFALRCLPNPGETEEDAESRARRTGRWAILSGLFAGLGAGTKYTGILGLLTLLTVLLIARPPRSWKLGLLGVTAAAVGFLASTPGALVNFAAFSRDFAEEALHVATGHGIYFVQVGSGFAFHLMNLAEGIGGFLVVLSTAGLFLAPARLRAPLFALLAFAIPYYLLIGKSQVMFLRYTFPLYFLLAFGIVCLVERAFESPRWGRWAVVFGMLGLGGVPIWGGLRASAVMTLWMAGEDPRDSAARLLKRELAKTDDATVGIPSDPWYYTPPVFPNSAAPRQLFLPFFEGYRQEALRAGVVQYVPPNPRDRFDWDVRLLTELEPAYVVFSSFEAKDLERLKDRKGLDPVVSLIVSRYKEFLDELKSRYAPFAVYGDGFDLMHDLEYIRPTIWIWKRK